MILIILGSKMIYGRWLRREARREPEGGKETKEVSLLKIEEKDLETGRFELYRRYHVDGSEEVILTGSLGECLKRAGEEWKKYHYGWVEPEFKSCRHRPPEISALCPKRRVIAPV